MSKINNAIGVLGGSFDPPHIGHLKISKTSLKKLNLKKIYWTVTKKNPLKRKPFFSINERIKKCREISKKDKKIHVEYLDDKIKSSRTIKTLKYLIKKNKKSKVYLIIGSDNLIHFHKWFGWKKILKMCKLVIFPRKGFDIKAKKSKIMRVFKNKNIIFIKNQKIDISSTKLRKYYKKNIFNGSI